MNQKPKKEKVTESITQSIKSHWTKKSTNKNLTALKSQPSEIEETIQPKKRSLNENTITLSKQKGRNNHATPWDYSLNINAEENNL